MSKTNFNPIVLPSTRDPNKKINFSNKYLPNQFERNKALKAQRVAEAKARFPKKDSK